MRLLVLFDLPVKLPRQKKAYTTFRRFLLKDGYDMLQWSVYARLINGHDAMQKHLNRLADNLPPEGSIRALQISERQFVTMRILLGSPTFQESAVSRAQLLLF